MVECGRYLILFFLQLILVSGLLGQQNKGGFIRTEFSVFSFRMLDGLHFQSANKKSESVKFYSGRSYSYQYEGQNPLIFFREIAAPTTKDPLAVKRLPVASVKIPNGQKKLLLIFFPDKKAEESKERYQIVPLNDSFKNLPKGHVAFFNISGKDLEGLVGQTKVKLTHGPSKAFNLKGKVAKVKLLSLYKEGYRPAFDGDIKVKANQRLLILFYPPYREGSSRVQPRYLNEYFKETKPPK